MEFVSDPPISVKIRKMKERVRWGEPQIVERGIDQTRMVLEDGWADSPEFSFLVIGDTGSGAHRGGQNPQRRIAELMLANRDACRFVLHTGDVIYMVGSSEFYPKNFIKPYREFILGGEQLERIAYKQMNFTLPILPVPGNHDYYDLPFLYGLMVQSTLPIRRLLQFKLDLDIGWHGSHQGRAYARAFLDYLKDFEPEELRRHLDRHYTAQTDTGPCLSYKPGHFTRLPNRYYTFRSGGIDFFALDSNTFNAPPPLPATRAGEDSRRLLKNRLDELDQQKLQLLETSANLNSELPDEAEQLDDLRTKLTQIDEVYLDIEKQLASDEATVTDFEQLDWLRQRLIESWNTAEVRGRVIYFHHPPYVTEATKWHQAQTLAIRRHIRRVLDEVSEAVGSLCEGRPPVDLILNGHAHCLEYLRTGDTGHADSNLNWIVCGGSGFSLRRQRSEGPELTETFGDAEGASTRKVAESLLYVSRNGQGAQKRRPYSFLRIDVKDGRPPKFIVRPYIAEQFQRQWSTRQLEPFVI